jgi:hypothetical protein
MNCLQIYLLVLLIFLVIIALVPYGCFEGFTNIPANSNININLDEILTNNYNTKKKSKPRVIVPIYAPWRMYYPYEYVYPFVPLQSSPFYPFFDQYNIYQGIY